MKIIRTLIALSLILSIVSCSSTTLIRSSDQEAKIFVDGEYKGKGVGSHTDQKTVGSTTQVRIEKDGCDPQYYNFTRNEEFDAGACIGGVFVLVPFLWIQKYKPERNFDYVCQKKK